MRKNNVLSATETGAGQDTIVKAVKEKQSL